MVGMELSIRKTRAAELLTAAAAHRTFVEHRLGGDQTTEAQQQIGHQLAEMVEGAGRGRTRSLKRNRSP